jgi:hypothetical protein
VLLGLWFILWLTTDILDSYRWSVVSNLDARLLYISIYSLRWRMYFDTHAAFTVWCRWYRWRRCC